MSTSELTAAVRRDLTIAREMERLGLLRPWVFTVALRQKGRVEVAAALRQGPVHGLLEAIAVDAGETEEFTMMPGEAARALLLARPCSLRLC